MGILSIGQRIHKPLLLLTCVIFLFLLVPNEPNPISAENNANPVASANEQSNKTAGNFVVYLPVSLSNEPVIIPDTTEVLTEETTNALSSVSPDLQTFTFNQSTDELNDLDPGDVMVGNVSNAAPDGFLRKVTQVSHSNGQVIVSTTPAALDEAIDTGSISASKVFTPADIESAQLRSGVSIANQRLNQLDGAFVIEINDVVLYDDDQNLNTTDDQIKANGSIELEPEVDFSFKIRNGEVNNVSLVHKATQTVKLEVFTEASVGENYELEIAKFNLGHITVFAGPVPVIFVVEMTISVGVDGEIHIGVTTSVTQETTISAGLRYEDGDWDWYPPPTYQKDFIWDPPKFSLGGKLKGYGRAQLALKLYGIAGPYAAVQPYLELETDIFADPNWELYGGIEVPLGVEVEVMSKELARYEDVVFKAHILLAQGTTNQAPYPPFGPLPPDESINQSTNVLLQWGGGDPDPGDAVTYDVYFAANDITPNQLICSGVAVPQCNPGLLNFGTHYYWQVISKDSHGLTTTGEVWDFETGAVPNNPPYQPYNGSPTTADGVQNINVTLSWLGGDPDPGDTVTYDVYFEAGDSTPDILLCSNSPSTNCSPSTLAYNTHYYWQVIARDSRGEETVGSIWDFWTGASPNNPPYKPYNPTPDDGAQNVPQVVSLLWSGGDPDPNDSVTYDVYFEAGDNTPDVLLCNDVFSTTCSPNVLNYNTQYFWQVIARDNNGLTTAGDVWDFTTVASPAESGVSVPLIIDSTGSMLTNDPNNMRKAAGNIFIDASQFGDKIAVVGFDTVVDTLSPLRLIQSQTDRDILKAAVNQINSSGNTNLNAGLNEGYNQLNSDSSSNPKAAVFLTDGEQTSGAYNNISHQQYGNRGWPIYAIGLGNGTDEALLQKMADETNGQYFKLTDPNELQAVYFEISQQIAGGNIILSTSSLMYQGDSKQFAASMPSSSDSATFFIGWPGSQVDLSLVDPNGRQIGPGTVASDVHHAKGLTYELYTIQNPVGGQWTLNLYGASLPPGGEIVDIRVSEQGGPPSVCDSVVGIDKDECLALEALYNGTNGASWGNWFDSNTPCTTPWTGVTCGNGHVTNIELIQLGIGGTFPTELGNLLWLTQFRMDKNDISGTIPATLGDLTELTQLDIGQNQLNGTIPTSLCQLTKLVDLDLFENQLTGPIPSCLDNIVSLKEIFLDDNLLSGSIPFDIGNITPLTSLGVSRNNIDGTVPSSICSLTNLQYLYMHETSLTGSLPSCMTNLTQLKTLRFQNTNLCEPGDSAFQNWLASIASVTSTGVICP